MRKIARNDRVILTRLEGEYHYVVQDIQIVNPEDTRVLRPSAQPTLTLVTCYPFYFVGKAPQRFIVKANQIQRIQQ